MDQLPINVLEKILSNPILDIQDVFNFSLTCRYFYNSIVKRSHIWKTRFFEKWPKLEAFFGKEHNRYFEEFQYINDLKKRTRVLLAKMPPRFYKKYHLSDVDLEEWNTILNEREIQISSHYLLTDLAQILNTNTDIKSIELVPIDTPGNKTMQYYARKVFHYIKQLYVSKVLTAYMSLSPKLQILEELAALVAKWCQPEIKISYKCIAEELDRYAELVRRRLYEENPNHSLFDVPKERLDLWRVKRLTKSQFIDEEFHQILETLNQVIFYDLGFHSTTNFNVLENLYINKVLETKRGFSSILLIIYESVGRRLGLTFKPINLSSMMVLGFTDNVDVSASWYYVDLSKGTFGLINEDFTVATTQQVIKRVVELQELAINAISNKQPTNVNILRLQRTVLELHQLVASQDLTNLTRLANFYMSHEMNTRSLENHLMTQTFDHPKEAQRLLRDLQNFSKHQKQNEIDSLRPIEAKQRNNTVKFAVGMVMKHIRVNYKCVIIEWDPIYRDASPEWQTSNASLKHEQPFYYVLLEDDSIEYIAQEDLTPSTEPGSLCLNQVLGHKFSHFCQNHFVPNAETEKKFPYDKKIRHKFYHEMKLSV